ncbi:hypothetical protein JX266_011792 [Neoarthrinium moseri]|nr:hypothetical protein JX266_011792 [Neoarthrinium moseri]
MGNEDPGHYRREDGQPASKRRRERSASPDRDARKRHEDRRDRGGHDRRRSRSPGTARHRSHHEHDRRRERRSAVDGAGKGGVRTADHLRRGREARRSRSSSASQQQHPHRRRRRSSTHSLYSPAELPYSARQLSKADYDAFRPLLARYLEVQKNKSMADMDEREVRGRWKSFVSKWNEGSLAAGWYDPELFDDTRKHANWGTAQGRPAQKVEPSPLGDHGVGGRAGDGLAGDVVSEEGEDDEDGYGPALPSNHHERGSNTRRGPSIPSLQDLEVRREMTEEERLERIDQLRLERKADRVEQKARLEDLVPRAEAGTRERKLEKKKEVNEKMKSFRERSPGAAEVNDSELMGGGDGVDEYKRMKAANERKKTEREIRREEIMRAKNEEREERLREYREKEDKAMIVFKELARQRFG